MFCSKCGISLPDDAIVCYKCASPTNSNFQNHSPSVQFSEQNRQQEIPKTVTQNPSPVIVRNSSGFGTAFFTVLLLALLAGGGFLWYQQNKEHEYFGFKITDKGVSVSSDGAKSSWNSPTTSAPSAPSTPNPPTFTQRTVAPKSGATRIKFAHGRSSATVGGTVAKGGPDFYVVGARADQTMTVEVSGAVSFGVDSP